MNITRETVTAMRSDIEKALAEVEAKYGVKVNLGNARFSNDVVRFTKVEFNAVSKSGNVITAERKALERFFPQFVDKEVTFNQGRVTGKVVEYHSRKSKYPFIVETASGDRYKMPETQLEFLGG